MPTRPLGTKTPPSLPVLIPLPRLPLQLPPIPKSASSSVPQRQTLCWKEEGAAQLDEVDGASAKPGSKYADSEAIEEFYTVGAAPRPCREEEVVVVVFYLFFDADARCESAESTDTAFSLASTDVHGWRTRGRSPALLALPKPQSSVGYTLVFN
ncbi:hypothetical protein TSMEX_005090 [Taenia solium]|eukprot:TsM_000026700 transcript=TsM_000026700 gene=TsM_000026700